MGISLFVLLTFTTALSQAKRPSCHRGIIERTNPSDITPISQTEVDALAASLDWGWHDLKGTGEFKNYLSTMKNQHLPQYCGSCWAMATTSMMTDRLNIKHDKLSLEMTVSPQMLVSCTFNKPLPDYPKVNQTGCDGGYHIQALKWLETNPLYSQSCMSYRAKNVPDLCTPELACHRPLDGRNVTAKNSTINMFYTENAQPIGHQFDMTDLCNYNQTQGCYSDKVANQMIKENENMIMAELKNGPVACGIYAYSVLDNFIGETGVFPSPSKTLGEINHIVSIVGYGVKDGVKYWKIRNSWGDFWGNQGYFLLERGRGVLSIETNCGTAGVRVVKATQPMPINPTTLKSKVESRRMLSKTSAEYTKRPSDFMKYLTGMRWQSKFKASKKGGLNLKEPLPKFVVKTPLPQDIIDSSELVKELNYTTYLGQNILSWTLDQSSPLPCGSCYAQSALGAIADRANILALKAMQAGKNKYPIALTTLSVQQILDCGIGSCGSGGSFYNVHDYLYNSGGAVPFGCNVYRAESPPIDQRTCSAFQNCGTFTWFKESQTIKNFKKIKIVEHGLIVGAENMKKEIQARGPITCGIYVTDYFYDNYAGGVYSEKVWIPQINHGVAVVGWGVENGVEYWSVRNTWGTMWGIQGYFKIKMYEDNLGIESNCAWAVPELNL